MNTSSSAVSQIAEFEGIRLHPYNDVAGNATVGIGHLLHKGPVTPEDKPLADNDAARALFSQDLKPRETSVLSLVHVPLNQNQFDSLVDFTYNLGSGTLCVLISATGLNQGNYDDVPKHILLYNKARVEGVLTVCSGLVRRRTWEANLFSTPVV